MRRDTAKMRGVSTAEGDGCFFRSASDRLHSLCQAGYFTERYVESRSLAIVVNCTILAGENGCQTFNEDLKTRRMPFPVYGPYLGFKRVEKD
jgi:hypothetical protein